MPGLPRPTRRAARARIGMDEALGVDADAARFEGGDLNSGAVEPVKIVGREHPAVDRDFRHGEISCPRKPILRAEVLRISRPAHGAVTGKAAAARKDLDGPPDHLAELVEGLEQGVIDEG